MVQIGQSSPQQWSEYFTAAYMGSPPPTRWSTQRANGQYKDHLVGQLTTLVTSIASMDWVKIWKKLPLRIYNRPSSLQELLAELTMKSQNIPFVNPQFISVLKIYTFLYDTKVFLISFLTSRRPYGEYGEFRVPAALFDSGSLLGTNIGQQHCKHQQRLSALEINLNRFQMLWTRGPERTISVKYEVIPHMKQATEDIMGIER